MTDVEYNGILASSLGIYAKNIPDIPAAVRKEKTVDIPGMDGTLSAYPFLCRKHLSLH